MEKYSEPDRSCPALPRFGLPDLVTAIDLATFSNSVLLIVAPIKSKVMATSMAAALAASLPAPQAASTPAAPTYEAIPASMSKVVDIEAEIPLTCVQIDGLVSGLH